MCAVPRKAAIKGLSAKEKAFVDANGDGIDDQVLEFPQFSCHMMI